MRLLITASLALPLAACATGPREDTPAPATSPAAAVRPAGALVGLSASELIGRFGQPSLQVREGPGLKLQWAGAACVLDAFLYPSTGGHERATHVEARRVTGEATDAQGCALTIAR